MAFSQEIVKSLIAEMQASGLHFFGLRAVSKTYRIHSYMSISHDWDHTIDQPSREFLSGSSTIGICTDDDLDDFDSVVECLASASQLIDNYYEPRVYLVGGLRQCDGNDEGEWIINNDSVSVRHGAKVLSSDLRAFIPTQWKFTQE